MTGLPVGAATVRVERTGYLPAEEAVTLSAGANNHDFALAASPTATLSGIVRAAVGSAPLEGAQVTAGQQQATTDAGGHFELTAVPVGVVTLVAQGLHYAPDTAVLTLHTGANTHDFALDIQEVYVSGSYAMYLPAGVGPLRGVIIALGAGVTTSGFVTGGPLEPGSDVLEASLQQLGLSLRAMAESSHVAILGTTIHSMINSPTSDNALFLAISGIAGLSGHAELVNAPILTFGLDAGGLESLGLVSRVPQRSIGVLVRVPVGMAEITDPAVLAVPTFVMLSGLETGGTNASIQNAFLANRSRGGLWGLAVEPGVQHAEATALGNEANVSWIRTALALRLPAVAGDSLRNLTEASGWLGNQTTGDIAAWADYPDDRGVASWLLSDSAATTWQRLGGFGPAPAPHLRPNR